MNLESASLDKPYSLWEITNICNYRCHYCNLTWEAPGFFEAHKGIAPEQWSAFWERLHGRHGSFLIELIGGEPSASPLFFTLVPRLQQWHTFLITTNLSWDVQKGIRLFSPGRTRFIASFHPQFAAFETFVGKTDRLRAAGFDVKVTMVAYPGHWSEAARYLGTFRERGYPCWPNPFQGRYNGRDYPASYTDEQKRWMHEQLKDMPRMASFNLEEFNPKGLLCEAGVRYMRIKPDGTIFRCGQTLWMGHPPIGNIRDPGFELMPEASPCPADRCYCENFCLKEKPGSAAKISPACRPARALV